MKKRVVITAVALVIVAGGLVAWFLLSRPSSEHPSYTTVTPQSNVVQWTRVSPPNGEPVYAYTDTINGTSISVSQQPLPESFRTNTEQSMAELAKQYNATTEIDASGTKVYLGTSAKGPQSVLFTKHSLLILIKSQGSITSQDWASYVESLR